MIVLLRIFTAFFIVMGLAAHQVSAESHPVLQVTPPSLKETADAMRAKLSQGSAIDAVRLGNEILSDAHTKQGKVEASEVFGLQMQGYLRLGLSQTVIRLLRERIAITLPESAEMPQLLSLLGQASLLGGRLEDAEQAIDKALMTVTGLQPKDRVWPLILKTGLRYRQKKNSDALKLNAEAVIAADASGDPTLKAYAFLQKAQVSRQSNNITQAAAAYKDSLAQYQQLSNSSDSVYGIVASAEGLSRLTSISSKEQAEYYARAIEAYSAAVEISIKIGDDRARSQSFGKWGELLEINGQLEAALDKTLHALHYAQQARLIDLVYVWHHQSARILKKQKNPQALDMYRLAAQSLNLFKKGLSSECGIADGSFQDITKPVYQDLAEQLIVMAAQVGSADSRQQMLAEARATIEALRTEELRDYFEDACLGSDRSSQTVFKDVPSKTAMIYTVMLPGRTDLLVSLPDGLKHFKALESSAVIGREVRLLRMSIENRFPAWITSARKLYDWLIRPLEEDLKRHDVKTLVFVPDGPLRNIPLTVLNDGSSSIIDKYAVATIQGLGFTSPLGAGRPGTMLLAGISESVQGYPALTNVLQEEKGIRSSFSGISLINSEFRVQNVKEQLDLIPYPLIHIASHGEFTGNSRNNYVLTWDGRLTLNDLDRFIKSSVIRKTPVELISLSACKTAAGDDRASLGLAGLVVKSGARTAVASLWDIDDKSTAELFVEFYQIVKDRGSSIGRAEALRQAQREIRKRYDHPYFWSPFLLIGNWL